MIEWREIPETNYLASSEGQIRHRSSGTPRKLQLHPVGYFYVNFWRKKKLCVAPVHSLVAAAFHGPRLDGAQIRHLDGDRSNNRPDNLKYGSALENAADRERHGKTMRGERNGNAVISNADADFIRLLYARRCASQYELAVLFKVSQAQVNNIVLNKQRRAA